MTLRLWECGQRKGVAHTPTAATTNAKANRRSISKQRTAVPPRLRQALTSGPPNHPQIPPGKPKKEGPNLSKIRTEIFDDISTVIAAWLDNGANFEDVAGALTGHLAGLISNGRVEGEGIVALLADGIPIGREEREARERCASEDAP
jgi:hypothetical protein